MSIIKKIFFFSLFILFISILFYGVYIISFKKDIEIPEEITEATNSAKKIVPENIVPDITEGKIYPVSENEVISPIISLDGENLLYFSKKLDKLVKTDLDENNEVNISNKSFSGIQNLLWSLDKTKILVKTKDENGNYANYSYDIKNDSLQELSKNIYTFTWQTNADRIFYEYYDREKNIRTLNVSDPDGKNWMKLLDIPFSRITLQQIPKTGFLSFWNSGDAYTQTKLQLMPIAGGEIKTIFENGFGADYLWNNGGDYLIVSQSESKGGQKMQLAIMNYNGGEYRNLDIPTFSSKCTWSKNGKTLFYALPSEIPENSILPNDYKEKKFYTADTFWKINLETGEKKRIVEIKDIKERYDATDLFLNPNENILFFVNRIDKKLYKIVL